MEKKERKYIKKVEIKGLFGRYDVNWALNPDVNILVGENGTGKSTILRLINAVIFANGYNVSPEKNEVIVVTKQGKDYDLFDMLSIETSFEFGINSRVFDSEGEKNIRITKIGDDDLGYFFERISTFDDSDSRQFLDARRDLELNKNLITDLDKELQLKIEKYVDYQLTLNRRVIEQEENPAKVFTKFKLFKEAVNRLFSNTGKQIDNNANRLVFILDDGKKIMPYQLSSGEKQLLILLITVLCQDEKSAVLLLDEPEISLHISWQYELIKILQSLNSNCQLIIVTHSTGIFTKGWMDKLFFTSGKESILQELTETV